MVEIGAITEHVDIAQIALYAFWIFFAALIIYLRREDRREGYPMEQDPVTVFGGRTPSRVVPPRKTEPKVFKLPHGGTSQSNRPDTREIKAEPVGGWPGAPLQPTGNPMLDGVGPASYAERAQVPDQMLDGSPKIVPLRTIPAFSLETRDPDPRGMPVIAGDGKQGGVVTDAWIDQMEMLVRYLEVEPEGGGASVLLPINFATVRRRTARVEVNAIFSRQFADVPKLANPQAVTLREEDQIAGYYGGGMMYAEPRREGPVL